jgi:hypothetical protein
MEQAHVDDIAGCIRECGLQNRKAEYIKAFSSEWMTLSCDTPIREYTGIGEYAEDSYNIFVEGYVDQYVHYANGEPVVTVKDKELNKYLLKQSTPQKVKGCPCDDWQENITEINGTIQLQAIRTGGKGYTGKQFTFCPWCASILPED